MKRVNPQRLGKGAEDKRNPEEDPTGVAMAMKRSLETAGEMPGITATDEELGGGDLVKILPDTWHNISWLVQNAVEVLRDQSLGMRRMLEEVK